MGVRIITEREVAELLPMGECVDVMAEAFRTLARGNAVQPLRTKTWLPDGSGLLGLMPGVLGEPACIGIKVITVMPGNHGSPYDSHQGTVMVFEVEHGCLLAIVDASSITAIRTAAVSGLATRLLARPHANDLAMIGSGVQARSHLEAMRAVRDLKRVRVWSRSPENARRFAEQEGRRLGLAIETAPSARDAVQDADLICTTTSSRGPVLEGAWIAPGAHINAVGACLPGARELDTAAVARSRLFTDRRESLVNEAGDFLIAKQEGAIGDDHIAGEIGDVLIEKIPGRRSSDEVTLFESLGLAVEDLAAAHQVYRKAVAGNRGLEIEIGGRKASPTATT